MSSDTKDKKTESSANEEKKSSNFVIDFLISGILALILYNFFLKKVDTFFLERIYNSQKMVIGDIFFVPRLLFLGALIIVLTCVLFVYLPLSWNKIESMNNFFAGILKKGTYTKIDDENRQKKSKNNSFYVTMVGLMIFAIVIVFYYGKFFYEQLIFMLDGTSLVTFLVMESFQLGGKYFLRIHSKILLFQFFYHLWEVWCCILSMDGNFLKIQ